MSNFFEIECSINDNPNNLEIINYDVNEIVISPCLPTTPADYIELIDGEINNFIFAGSGINLIPTSTGLFIESELFGGSGIIVSESSGTYTIDTNDSYIDSLIQDGFNTNLAAGTGIIFSYDNNTLYLNSIIQAGTDIGITSQSGVYTIAFTGVYPTGNFSLVGHQHLSTDITDFDIAVSGLIPSITGSGYINSNFSNNGYTISVSGLQPSGNYSLVGHSHMSSDISDFNSSVSGILPVKNIFGGSGILVTSSGSDFTVSVTGQFGLTGEEVDDRVSNLLVPGDYINLNYNDLSDTLNIGVTGLQPSGNYSLVGHSHTSSDITDFNSSVSGLIPPQSITSLVGVSGIIVTNSGSTYTVSLSDPIIELSDISDLSSDARTFLLTPSSNNLQGLVSDETGTGALVFNTSPSFSGVPTAPTAPSGTNNNQIASTQFVRSEIANLVDSAPSTLDTLNELAAALGDDANFSTTITNSLAGKANLSGATFTGPVVIPSGTGNFNSLTVNSIDVSVSGHTHAYTDITNFGSGVSNSLTTTLLPGSFIVLDYNLALDTLTISASGLQPSGNYSTVGHTHTSSDITNFNSSVSGLLPVKNILGSGYIDVSSSSGVYTVIATGLQPSGNYSLVGHTHVSSDITDFNSSVSGLLPVKNISAGSGIGISSSSGDFTVSVTGTFGLTSEEVDDRVSQLLVAGTGVSLTYNDPSGTLTIDNLHSEINVLSQEPQGFVNRADSLISFNDTTRTFTIQPAVSGGSYTIYAEGIKVTKSGIETVIIGSGTALNYIHFDTTPPYTLHTKTTGFNFDSDIPIGFIHWNGDINQSTFFGEERHGIRMDSVTHKWIHNTFGMQYISGLSIGGYVLLGNGSSNSHAQIDISDGVLYQEDIVINVTDDNGTNSANEFVQPLSPIAYIPVYYHSGSSGQWVRDVATAFPLKYNATRAQYNLYSGGTWTTPNVTNNRYFAMWIVATNDMNDPILAIIGQREDSSLTAAESNNNWSDINLTNIPTQELRPLYRLIFVTNDTFTNTPKSSLQAILDIRRSIQSVTTGIVQNDHGSLFGLADDDHNQYVHIDNARTIDAVHTFVNGLNASGLINATSGNFSTLQVNGTGVSLSGHTHTASNITDFNSSVSGLLPTISNSGDNRILTSDGTSTGLNAENNLTFDGSFLNVAGSGSFSNNVTASGFVRSGGTSSQFLKADGSVDSNTYYLNSNPSGYTTNVGTVTSVAALTLGTTGTDVSSSVVNSTTTPVITLNIPSASASNRGLLTSSDWTTFNNKQNALTNPITGTGTSGYLSRFNSSTGLTNSIVFESGTRLGVNTISPSGALHVIGSGLIASVTGTAPNSLFHIYSATSGASIFNVEGTNGSLFSVDDNLSGTLMSVNNNAGLPVFEVFSDDRVVAGRFNQNDFVVNSSGNIGIGNSGDNTYKINITGSGNFTGDVLASGNMTGRRLVASRSSGSEGGILSLAKPASGASTSGTFVNIDMFNNQLRIYEAGSPNRGYYLDITEANSAVATPLKTTHIAGSGISLEYNSPNNTLTINASTNIINSANLYLWSNFR